MNRRLASRTAIGPDVVRLRTLDETPIGKSIKEADREIARSILAITSCLPSEKTTHETTQDPIRKFVLAHSLSLTKRVPIVEERAISDRQFVEHETISSGGGIGISFRRYSPSEGYGKYLRRDGPKSAGIIFQAQATSTDPVWDVAALVEAADYAAVTSDGMVKISVEPAKLQFVVKHDDKLTHVWEYQFEAKNSTAHDFQLFGRRLLIDEGPGGIIEQVPFSGHGWALAVAGEQPIVRAKTSRTFLVGVATDSPNPVSITGAFLARDLTTEVEFEIAVPRVTFRSTQAKAYEIGKLPGAPRLSRADSQAVAEYVRPHADRDNRLFRADAITDLSDEGKLLLNCFLLHSQRLNRGKRRTFDLADILCDDSSRIVLESDDHFILPALEPAKHNTLFCVVSCVPKPKNKDEYLLSALELRLETAGAKLTSAQVFLRWIDTGLAVLAATGALPDFRQDKTHRNDGHLTKVQLDAVLTGSTLGRLSARYEERLKSTVLPRDGFNSQEQADAAARLSKTYADLKKRQLALGIEPTPKHERVSEAERLRIAFDRSKLSSDMKAPSKPVSVRRRSATGITR